MTTSTTQPLKVPYRGARASYFVYHPKQLWNQLTLWDDVAKVFHSQLKTWYEVSELYEDEMTRHEKIVSDEVKREINGLLAEAEKEHNVYILEALAEALWDKTNSEDEADEKIGKKTEKHYVPYYRELQQRAAELRAEDIGLVAPSPILHPLRRTWTG